MEDEILILNSEVYQKYGKCSDGNQRYFNKKTKKVVKLKYSRHTEETKLEAVKFYVDAGISIRNAAKHYGVSHVAFMNWIDKFYDQIITYNGGFNNTVPIDSQQVTEIQMDEIYHIVEKKR